MKFSLSEQSEKYLKKRARHRYWMVLVGCLGLVAAVGTGAVLKHTGEAKTYQDKVLQCAYQVHEHERACYDENNEKLICGLADYVVHTHNDDCYDAGELVCPLPEIEEHHHSASCYTTETVVTCGHSESAGHIHSGSCYESEPDVLSCGQDEHTHSDDCYTYDEETEESYLSCGRDEHTHSGDCYTAGGSYLACGYEEGEGAHAHDSSCYETREELTCGKLENHTHDERACYDEYDNLTCDKIVLEKHVHTGHCFQSVERVIGESESAQAEQPAETEDPQQSDTDEASDEPADEASDEPADEASQEIPEEDASAPVLQKIFEGDGFRVTAEYTEDAGIPEEAELVVTLVEDDEHYNLRVEEASALLDGRGEAPRFLYNIAFLLDGEEIEPTATVNITFQIFDGSLPVDVPVMIIHYGDEGPEMLQDSTAGQAGDGSISTSFAADSFSDFLLVIGASGTETEAEETPEPVDWTENVAYLLSDTFIYETDDFIFTFLVDGVVTAAREETVAEDAPEAESSGEITPEEDAAAETTADDATAEPAETEETAEPVEIAGTLSSEFVELQLSLLEEDTDAYNELLTAAEENGSGELLSLSVLALGFAYDGVALDVSACDVTAQITPRETLLELLETDGSEAIAEEASHAPTLAVLMDSDGAFQEADSMVLPVESEAMPVMTLSVEGRQMAVALYGAQNPTFTVQYWANLEEVVVSGYTWNTRDDNVAKNYVSVIDTSVDGYNAIIDKTGAGAAKVTTPQLPSNSGPYAKKLLALNNDGSVQTTTKLTQILTDKDDYQYFTSPGLAYIDRLAKNTSYELKEIWVKQLTAAVQTAEEVPVADAAALAEETPEADIATLSEETAETAVAIQAAAPIAAPTAEVDWTTHDTYNPATVTFTNNPSAVNENTVLIQEGTVIRLVYDVTTGSYNNAANFYDYDITDGYIYSTKANATNGTPKINISQQSASTTYYVRTTGGQGINSASNYSGSGAKLAFGNGNTGTNLNTQKWGTNTLNIYNTSARDKGSSGATFGLVTGLNGSNLVYASGVIAPKLFDDGTAVGKTAYSDYSLNFTRVGDTYTLYSVNGTSTTGLDKLFHPGNYSHILTNNFWPMDAAPSWATNYHDLKFGSSSRKSIYSSTGVTFPKSDDGTDHNSYFGMQYAMTFEYDETYVGPLEYYFYGDDDLWVFLDGTLICDIGGVHSSIGEYVNLWDYLSEKDAGTHTLRIFYTERGASGSTCYMRFTLPSVSSIPPSAATGSLQVAKTVDGPVEDGKKDYKFAFTLTLDGVNGTTQYPYTIFNASGVAQSSGTITKSLSFKLQDGEYIRVDYLPPNATYTVTEATADWYTTSVDVSGENSGASESGNKTAVNGTITGGSLSDVTFTNHTSYELPHTGGAGAALYLMGGGAVLLLALVVTAGRKRRRGAHG